MAVGVFGILFFGDDFNLYFLNIRIWVLYHTVKAYRA